MPKTVVHHAVYVIPITHVMTSVSFLAHSRLLFQEEMKHGHISSLVSKVLFLGAAGSGKTSSKRIILNETPPALRISTPCAERPVKIVRIEVDGLKLRRLQAKEEKIIVAKIMKARAARRFHMLSKSPPTGKGTRPRSAQKVNQRSPPPSSKSIDGDNSTLKAESMQMSSGQASSPVKDDSGPNITAALKSLSATEEEFVDLIEQSSGSEALMQVELVQITDTGGQPQFHEVLPAFLRGTTICIFVQKLSECLDAHPQVEYYDENGIAICTPYRSPKTNLQILKHCIRTMQSFRCQKGRGKAPKLVFIGTYKDREHECSETRETKNQKLVEILLPAFEEEVVYYQLDKEELIFPLNARFPGEEERRIAEDIQRLIITKCCSEPVNIPLRWYALEISLREIVEVCQWTRYCKRYTRWIKGLGTRLVKANHEGGVAYTRGWKKFQDHGLVTLEFLAEVAYSKNYVAAVVAEDSRVEGG